MDPAVVARFIGRLDAAFQEDDAEALTKTHEAENVRVLREQYEAIGRGDFPAVLGYFADDVELEILGPSSIPFLGRWQGRDRVAEAMVRNFAMIDEQVPELVSVIAQGDSVVVIGHDTGRWRSTGEPYELHWVHHYTMRGGRISRLREYVAGAGPQA